jgi:hypothetical protein
MTRVNNIEIGKPDTSITKPSHVRGVRRGNQPGGLRKQAGVRRLGRGARGDSARSTGINADKRNPVDPRSPNLSPP